MTDSTSKILRIQYGKNQSTDRKTQRKKYNNSLAMLIYRLVTDFTSDWVC